MSERRSHSWWRGRGDGWRRHRSASRDKPTLTRVMEAALPAQLLEDPVLRRFRAALDNMFGDRIERVVLFGSRARGEATEDSDYDVAVFLRDFTDRWPEVDRLVEIETDLLYDVGAFVHAMPFRAGAWQERSPLMGAIRREGIDL
jgi:uncharacterized protein